MASGTIISKDAVYKRVASAASSVQSGTVILIAIHNLRILTCALADTTASQTLITLNSDDRPSSAQEIRQLCTMSNGFTTAKFTINTNGTIVVNVAVSRGTPILIWTV